MTTYYVYFTDQCKQDAGKHSVTNEVEKFAEKLEREQSTRGLERFPRPYLKKSMGRQGRLVIEEHRSGTDSVLCLARYLIRGSSEYNIFYKDPTDYYEKNKVHGEDVEAFLKEREKEPIATKKSMSDRESAYLQSTSAHHSADDGIYMESYDWFERISQSWAKDSLVRYYDLIEFGKLPEDKTVVSHTRNPSVKILYRHFPEYKYTFLIAPIDTHNREDEDRLREKYKNILDPAQGDVKEAIDRNSRRTYPSIIACDEDTWVQVQNSNEANLALSTEEKDILESILRSSNDGPKYPLFINGRPGSGKSTILQYLFSEHLRHHIDLDDSKPLVNPPLYLTYSRQLLEQARSSVENILTCGAKSLQDGKEPRVATALLNQSFRNFREFLLDQLPSEEREKFASSKYISFELFRKKWESERRLRPEKDVRDIGPELAWHAIRTFIKGMQDEPGTEVDPEFYKIELARDSKSISDVTFKLIYEMVWKWYSELCVKEKYWDDQDLVRSVLQHSADKLSRYPAVFCDEAQDFTKIELELIERLSLYSDRILLSSHLAKHVPFAFAGDPFQTLNPTGFNWSAMQASFHDNIAQQIDGSGRLKFNFKELFLNYRSSEQIVKLANLIQLLRAVLLDLKLDPKELRPQQCWKREEIASPVWFRHDDASCKSKIREQEELVIIIPCQENGELEYIQNDDFLSDFALQDGRIQRNILSPARAKGLEYDRILLYRFGDEASKRIPELIQYISEPARDPLEIEQRLAWEYFLNQFYVAVSRARKRLFIVDSDNALKGFWHFAEPKKQSELLELYQNNEEWKHEDVGGIVQGDETSWSEDRDDPLDLAKRWQEQGLAQRDPFQLDLAKSNFERAGRPEKAKLCEAKAYEFRDDFIKAGDSFKVLEQADDACRCYWAGEDSYAIVDLAQKFPKVASDPRFLAAIAIRRDKNTLAQIETVLRALESVEVEPSPNDSGESTDWRWFFKKFIPKVSEAIESSNREKSDWEPLVERLVTTLRRLGIASKAYPTLGRLYYWAGDLDTAIKHWGECPSIEKQDQDLLIQAKAQNEPYPGNVSFFERSGDHKSVVKAWRDADGGISQETPVNQILKSAVQVSDRDAIRNLLPACNERSTILEAIQTKDGEPLTELRGAFPVAIANCLGSSEQWTQIVNFATSQTVPDGQLNTMLRALKIQQGQAVTIAAVVRVLARSERLADERPKSQQTVSEFLKRYLIVNNHSKKEQKTIVDEVHKLVSVAEVGAAFERAFRLTFALEYYEQWFTSPEDEKFTKRRWLMCKRRLGEHEGPRSERHLNEAEQKGQEWNLRVDSEPEYPELPPIAALNLPASREEQPVPETPRPDTIQIEEAAPNRKTSQKERIEPNISASAQISIDGLELNVSILTKKKRIRLIQADRQDEVACDLRKRKVSSEDVSVEQIKDDESVKTWLIKEWDIYCEIQLYNNNFIIRFRTQAGISILGFEL